MFAVYASEPSRDEPLKSLTVGERPEPEVADGWVSVEVAAASLNMHDLWTLRGVGIKLDHYSGSQYNAGRKIPSSQMRRGDMLFWGPNASQHVALYLGDGQMLEAPYTGSHVKVSPVRSIGMTPYATRLIEW